MSIETSRVLDLTDGATTAAGQIESALCALALGLRRATTAFITEPDPARLTSVLITAAALHEVAGAGEDLAALLSGPPVIIGGSDDVIETAARIHEQLHSRLSIGQIASALSWHASGMSDAMIAELLNVSASTVSRVLRAGSDCGLSLVED